MATQNFDPTMLAAPQEIANQVLIPTLTGGALSLMLCGMCVPRLFDYYSHFPKDRRRNKVAVLIVGLGVIFYAVLQLIFIVQTGSMNIHTIASLSSSNKNTSIFPIAYPVISLPTQLVMAERSWKLNGNNKLLAAWLGFIITASFAVILVKKDVFTCGSALFTIIPVSAIVYLITDLTIVVSILFGLHRTSKDFLASPTEGFGGVKLVRAAWQTSVESAMFPTLLNIITLALHYIKPKGLLFSYSSFMIPPVYCMTLLFSLERRQAHLDASHFHCTMLNSLPRVRPTTTSIISPINCLSRAFQYTKHSVNVMLSGDRKGKLTQRSGPVIKVDESKSDQPSLHQLKWVAAQLLVAYSK